MLFLNWIPVLVFLFYLLKSSYSLQVMKNENFGLVIEESGQILTHNGHLYIPIIFKMPDISDYWASFKYCGITNNSMVEIIKRTQQYVKSLIPIKTDGITINFEASNTREKRSLSGIASVIGIVGNIWNQISLYSLKNEVKTLRTMITDNQDMLYRLNQTSIILASNQRRVVGIINQLIESSKKISHEVSCFINEQIFFDNLISSYLTFGPSEMMRAINSALIGKVNPDLLPYHNLDTIVNALDEIKESPYRSHLTLIYELGEFLLDSINVDPMMITGILILPRLSNKISLLARVYSVNFLNANINQQLILPSIIAIEHHSNTTWVPDLTDCTHSINSYVCPEVIKNKYDVCIESILVNMTLDKCNLIRVPDDFTKIIHLRSGLLIGYNLNLTTQIVKVGHNRKILLDNFPLKGKVHFISSKQGDHLIINNQHYNLIVHREEFTFCNIWITNMTNYTIFDTPIQIIDEINDNNYKTYHHLSPLKVEYDILSLSVVITVIVITMLISVTSLILSIHILKKTEGSHSSESKEMEESPLTQITSLH